MFNLIRKNFEAFATVPDAFAPHEVDIISGLIAKQEKVIGILADGVTDKQIRDSRVHWLLSGEPSAQWIFERIAGVINTVNLQYFGMELTATEDIQLTEYDAEYKGFYGAHTDSGYGMTSARNRKLSLTMQLSDTTEYEGGDLKLYWHNLNEPFVASRNKGAMTLFRSHIIHEVTPVTKGTRRSLVSWVHGPLFT